MSLLVDKQPKYRLYSFVAGGYISQMQAGLQTAHVVSELYFSTANNYGQGSPEMRAFDDWAAFDKVIIICDAFNSKGVIDAGKRLEELCDELGLPTCIFYEDQESLNGAATACGVIVPDKFYDVKYMPAECIDSACWPERYIHTEMISETEGREWMFSAGVEFEFIKLLKSFKLYRG